MEGSVVKELTDVKQNVLSIPDDQNGQFTTEELDEILNYVTTVQTLWQFSKLKILYVNM